MMLLKGKLLEVRELPGTDRYPASCLVSILDGTKTLNLVGRQELLDGLSQLEAFDYVTLELRWKAVDLQSLGGSGRGKAYRLSVIDIEE